MNMDDSFELDARIAWVLHLGSLESKPRSGLSTWQERELEARHPTGRTEVGTTIAVSRHEIASAVAELAEVNDPTRPETVDVLVALVRDVQESGQLGQPSTYLIGGLYEFGWPLRDPKERIVEHVIAATDLGLFDPPDEPRRPRPESPSADTDSATHWLGAIKPEPHLLAATIMCTGEPPPSAAKPDPPTLRELFLSDWERVLAGIVEALTEELAQADFIDIGPG